MAIGWMCDQALSTGIITPERPRLIELASLLIRPPNGLAGGERGFPLPRKHASCAARPPWLGLYQKTRP
jgi:hypothetical protein